MSWGQNTNAKPGEGSKFSKLFILNHKERGHPDYNPNIDSNQVHRILGKHWSTRPEVKTSTSCAKTQRNQQLMDSIKTEMVTDKKKYQKDQKDKFAKGSGYQRKPDFTSTTYGSNNIMAEKQIEIAKLEAFEQRQLHKQKEEEKLFAYQNQCPQGVRKIQVRKNPYDNRPQTSVPKSSRKIRTLQDDQTITSVGSATTNCSPRKGNKFLQTSQYSRYDHPKKVTQNREPGYFTSKTIYSDLKEQTQTRYNTFLQTSKRFNTSAQETRNNFYSSQQDQEEEPDSKGINPFRMSTYDTVFGTPSKRYHKDEEEQKRKNLKAELEKKDKVLSLVSYKGVVPKALNAKYKWDVHQYEQTNDLRQAPVWASSSNFEFDPNKVYKRKGLVGGAGALDKVRGTNPRAYH